MKKFSRILYDNAEFLGRVALKIARNGEDAEDLVNGTIRMALATHRNYQEGSDLEAWLYNIMRNVFIGNYRRRVREKKIFYAGLLGLKSNCRGISIDNDAGSRSQNREIMKVFQKLPEMFRVPFHLCIEGFSYEEIAYMLDIAPGTVKSRIFHARKLLKKTSYPSVSGSSPQSPLSAPALAAALPLAFANA